MGIHCPFLQESVCEEKLKDNGRLSLLCVSTFSLSHFYFLASLLIYFLKNSPVPFPDQRL